MPATQPVTEAHAALTELLDYASQTQRKQVANFDIERDHFCVFEADIRHLPGVDLNDTAEGGEVWLRLSRLTPSAPPLPPSGLISWLIDSNCPDKRPTLRTCGLPETVPAPDLFDVYLQRWDAWASAESPRQASMKLYQNLFELQQRTSNDDPQAAIELVWGIGYSVWSKPGANPIAYPLITQACELSLDVNGYILEVRPRSVDPVLELDCYAELDVPGIAQIAAVWRTATSMAERRLTPFDASTFEPTLHAAAAHFDAAGCYASTSDRRPPASGSTTLCVSDTWVLFARKRSQHAFIQDARRFQDILARRPDLPPAARALVERASSTVNPAPSVQFRGLSSSGSGPDVKTLFFPKPYNSEQLSIAYRLEDAPGCVVQGPPGTGKSHSINNLICHYLAQGKRVLVASQGVAALAGLQAALPEAIRPLCVALLGNDRDSVKQFEHALQTMASNLSTLQPEQLLESVNSLQARIEQLHQELEGLNQRLMDCAAQHGSHHRINGVSMNNAKLAAFALAPLEQDDWFRDSITSTQLDGMLFTDADIETLRKARADLGENLFYLQCSLPDGATLPSAQMIGDLHTDLLRIATIEQARHRSTLPSLCLDSDELALADELHSYLLTLRSERGVGKQCEWVRAIYKTWMCDPDNPKILQLLQLIDEASERQLLQTDLQQVNLPPLAQWSAAFSVAVTRLAHNKRAFMQPFGKAKLRAMLNAVKLDSRTPCGAAEWMVVQSACQHRNFARQLADRWNALAAPFSLPQISADDPSALDQICALQPQMNQLSRLVRELEHTLPERVCGVFGNRLGFTRYTDSQLEVLIDCLDTHLEKARLFSAGIRVQQLQAELASHSGPVVDKMRELIRGLGQPEICESTLIQDWDKALIQLHRINAQSEALATVGNISGLIEQSGAPHWAERLRREAVKGSDDSILPASWRTLWERNAIRSTLKTLPWHAELRLLQLTRQRLESQLAHAYQSMVADKTWLEVYKNSPPDIRQELQKFLNAVQAIGAGTGIRAERHRKHARQAMERAYRAVPCWVMPIWRVAESLPSELGLFDLVIIDEASQSDISALPTLLRGKQMLLVGDHKQVSPMAVGIAENKVIELQRRFLNSQPHGSEMTPDKSIFDLARVVFASDSIMLKEHFRCNPEIITFSNSEFYSGSIRPLRLPLSTERLDPPLVAVQVANGYRDGDTNPPEAQAIVEQIERILADPSQHGRTLGVVTLLGNDQAPLIERLIQQRIPIHDIIERKIVAGTPAAFQGSERDIMFLSMVSVTGDRSVGNRLDNQQRYNVASSRARDRMYLYYSVEIESLDSKDLKARLIAHFQRPVQPHPHHVEGLRSRCQTDFERALFDCLDARGFKLTPQVQLGGYQIDLMVEGQDGQRLAIACDGDRDHAPLAWQHELSAQRVLERVGWTFWRCFEANFIRQRSAVLNDLFATLAQLGIMPTPSDEGLHLLEQEPQAIDEVDDPVEEVVHSTEEDLLEKMS